MEKDFVVWCHRNLLQLKASKAKELVIDFRMDSPTPRPVLIGTEEVEVVRTCKYSGLWLDNKLAWKNNTKLLNQKA